MVLNSVEYAPPISFLSSWIKLVPSSSPELNAAAEAASYVILTATYEYPCKSVFARLNSFD